MWQSYYEVNGLCYTLSRNSDEFSILTHSGLESSPHEPDSLKMVVMTEFLEPEILRIQSHRETRGDDEYYSFEAHAAPEMVAPLAKSAQMPFPVTSKTKCRVNVTVYGEDYTRVYVRVEFGDASDDEI